MILVFNIQLHFDKIHAQEDNERHFDVHSEAKIEESKKIKKKNNNIGIMGNKQQLLNFDTKNPDAQI